jgi:Zn-finger nucleic acid-binding protein
MLEFVAREIGLSLHETGCPSDVEEAARAATLRGRMHLTYRDPHLACPSCDEPLGAHAVITWCNACEGVWVSEAELEERVRVVRGKSELHLELVFAPGYPSSSAQRRRACPLCRQPLDHVALGEAAVDRCHHKHGIWFDAGELESVLHAATQGVAVHVPPVVLGPDEHVVLERIQAEENLSLTASDSIEAVAMLAELIAALLD